MPRLVLDLDSFAEQGYFYTKYDIGRYGHRIIIEEKDREKFLDAFAKEYRDRAAEMLMTEEEWDDE